MNYNNNINLKGLHGTKAETLKYLIDSGFNIPKLYFFSVSEWAQSSSSILNTILSIFNKGMLVVRSSSLSEDTLNSSMAGAFDSILNVSLNKESLENAILRVIKSYNDRKDNQIIVQEMVTDVHMSGVVLTKVLDDGSPYYVINYDDTSGLTDTVTSGNSINKTVYIYNGYQDEDFDNELLLKLLKRINELEIFFSGIPLDIEFAIDNEKIVHILQVRRITTDKKWDKITGQQVSERMTFLKQFVSDTMRRRPNIFGESTALGIMPDWNPAEMIGTVPKPLALSLYRNLITSKAWRLARSEMGYRKIPNIDLMISLYGRVYIDVRNSINSLLPCDLNAEICEKLTNAYLHRLKNHPPYHDKIEFEVVHTCYDFSFETDFQNRYFDILNHDEFKIFKDSLLKLTNKSIDLSENGSLQKALEKIEHLKELQNFKIHKSESIFYITDQIKCLINECIDYGTIPFSILARHGFIAESLLRSAVNVGAISADRIIEFKKSIRTISSEISQDFSKVIKGEMKKNDYLDRYGHLRPSSYDILSPNYHNRERLFEITQLKDTVCDIENTFQLTLEEKKEIDYLIEKHGFEDIKAEDIFDYADISIKGREYGKFIFTKHLSQIIELIAIWGEKNNMSREEMSYITIEDVLNFLFSPLNTNLLDWCKLKINIAKDEIKVANAFKLNYLIRSVRDIHIVPLQRSEPNFIGDKRIESSIYVVTPYDRNDVELDGKIVCIEGADPGYDWIFTRKIKGLITMFGGANSHMAIRCAEYGIPAAIGCGEQPYNRIIHAGRCLLDCQGKNLKPIMI